MNGYGKLRRCTEREARVMDFNLYLAAALLTIAAALSKDRTAASHDDGSAALVSDRSRGSPSAQRAGRDVFLWWGLLCGRRVEEDCFT